MRSRFGYVGRVVTSLSILATLAACGGGGSDATEVSPSASAADVAAPDVVTPNGTTVEVQVLDNSYRPIDLVIEAGTEVSFVNKGRNEHNILPDAVANDAELEELLATDASATSWGVASTDLPPGATFTHVFLEPGTYAYYCSIHGVAGKGMYGVVIVE